MQTMSAELGLLRIGHAALKETLTERRRKFFSVGNLEKIRERLIVSSVDRNVSFQDYVARYSVADLEWDMRSIEERWS
jgi:hypothetical protein